MPKPTPNNTYYFFLAIIILGSILRLWNLDSVPPSLNQDEAVNGVDAFTLGINLADHHGNFLPPMLQSFNDWASPTLTYLTVPFVKIFGLSLWSIRFANALVGIALIPLVYWLIKHLTSSSKAALFGSFAVAISPFAISLSRWAIPPSIVPTFLVLFLVCLFWSTTLKGLQSYFGFGLTGLSAAVLVYSYPTMKVYVPLLALGIFVIYFKQFWRQLLVCGGVFVAIISPIFYLTITQPNVYNARFNSVGLQSSSEGLIGGFLSRFGDYFSPVFLTGSSDSNTMHHVPRFGPIPELYTFLLYTGIAVCLYFAIDWKKFIKPKEVNSKSHFVSSSLITDNFETKEIETDSISKTLNFKFGSIRKPLLILILAFILFPVAPSLTVDKIILTRGVQGLTLGLIFISVGFWYLYETIKHQKFAKYLVAFLLLVSLFSTFQFSYFYFGEYSQSQKSNFQYGIKEMFAYLKDNESKFDKVEIVDINQPYIYKLFFDPQAPGTYDPKTMSSKIGKYSFGGVNKAELKEDTIIYKVSDNKDTWFKIYQYQPRWYVVTR